MTVMMIMVVMVVMVTMVTFDDESDHADRADHVGHGQRISVGSMAVRSTHMVVRMQVMNLLVIMIMGTTSFLMVRLAIANVLIMIINLSMGLNHHEQHAANAACDEHTVLSVMLGMVMLFMTTTLVQ